MDGLVFDTLGAPILCIVSPCPQDEGPIPSGGGLLGLVKAALPYLPEIIAAPYYGKVLAREQVKQPHYRDYAPATRGYVQVPRGIVAPGILGPVGQPRGRGFQLTPEILLLGAGAFLLVLLLAGSGRGEGKVIIVQPALTA